MTEIACRGRAKILAELHSFTNFFRTFDSRESSRCLCRKLPSAFSQHIAYLLDQLNRTAAGPLRRAPDLGPFKGKEFPLTWPCHIGSVHILNSSSFSGPFASFPLELLMAENHSLDFSGHRPWRLFAGRLAALASFLHR